MSVSVPTRDLWGKHGLRMSEKRVCMEEVLQCCRTVSRFSSATPNGWQHAKPLPDGKTPPKGIIRTRTECHGAAGGLAVGTWLIFPPLLDPTGHSLQRPKRAFRPHDSIAESVYFVLGAAGGDPRSGRKGRRQLERAKRVTPRRLTPTVSFPPHDPKVASNIMPTRANSQTEMTDDPGDMERNGTSGT